MTCPWADLDLTRDAEGRWHAAGLATAHTEPEPEEAEDIRFGRALRWGLGFAAVIWTGFFAWLVWSMTP